MIDTVSSFEWLNVSSVEAARRLLGCELVSEIDGQLVRARIVETEAYDELDKASHSYRGETDRNKAMFMSAGHMYVYVSYGIHHCCNIVCGKEGFGSGALVRAVEVIEGLDIAEARRGVSGVTVGNGPGKVCQALAIDRGLTGHCLIALPIRLIKRPALTDSEVVADRRVGISKAVDALRRFYIKGSPYVSRL